MAEVKGGVNRRRGTGGGGSMRRGVTGESCTEARIKPYRSRARRPWRRLCLFGISASQLIYPSSPFVLLW
eukprot:250953-Prymnesium_polylepis.1